MTRRGAGSGRGRSPRRLVDARTQPPFVLWVDGRRITALPGQSVAAALWQAGIRSWRRTAGGQPRGLFCGIGVCFDCLVTIDGRAHQRACLVPARAGAVVGTREGKSRDDLDI